ncbi:MAG: biotin--[acetyl-CoA-carboxylase] ligase [Cyanobacteria bacterium SIG26]|nr:biotin--[acetyl-CoA-carboxylase] ligase [Cyanobacteria bacterium SIG26]
MKVIKLEQVDSTNNYAKSNIENFADQTVIHAISQTSGRGRLSRSWVDLGVGNLFMTIILKPSESYKEEYSNLTQYMSVVLCKVFEFYGLEPQIKWPNDVLIDGKKIAGILSETVMSGSVLKGIVLGIGVNLNAQKETVNSIPEKLATALNLELGADVDLDLFMSRLLGEFFDNYCEFLDGGFEYIKKDYINRNCFLNKELNIQIFNNIETGLAKSITDSGELVLLKEDKELVLTIGDIL